MSFPSWFNLTIDALTFATETLRRITKELVSDDYHKILTPLTLGASIVDWLVLNGAFAHEPKTLVIADLGLLYTIKKLYLGLGYNLNNVYFVSASDVKSKAAQKMGILHTGKYNYTTFDLDIFGMNFDVIVGNPPFNDSVTSNKIKSDARRNKNTYMHVKFVKWALEHGKFVALICPLQEWFIGRGSKERQAIFNSKRLRRIDLLESNISHGLFGAKTGDIGILYLGDGTQNQTEVFVNEQFVGNQPNDKPIVFASSDQLVISLNQLVSVHKSIATLMEVSAGPKRYVARKFYVKGSPYKFLETVGPKNEKLELFDIGPEILDRTSELYDQPSKHYALEKGVNNWRIGLNQGGERRKLSAMKIIPPGVYTSYSVNTIVFPSDSPSGGETECRNAFEYLQTDFVNGIVAHTHHTASNGKTTLKFVPLLDFRESWTDRNKLMQEIALDDTSMKRIETPQ